MPCGKDQIQGTLNKIQSQGKKQTKAVAVRCLLRFLKDLRQSPIPSQPDKTTSKFLRILPYISLTHPKQAKVCLAGITNEAFSAQSKAQKYSQKTQKVLKRMTFDKAPPAWTKMDKNSSKFKKRSTGSQFSMYQKQLERAIFSCKYNHLLQEVKKLLKGQNQKSRRQNQDLQKGMDERVKQGLLREHSLSVDLAGS